MASNASDILLLTGGLGSGDHGLMRPKLNGRDTMTISIRQPLWVAGAIVLGLVTTQGPVVAQTLDCAEGIIQGAKDDLLIVDEIIIDGRSCVVAFVAVSGDVIVTNSENFVLDDSFVGGSVQVQNGRNVTITGNDIGERDTGTLSELIVKNNENALVILNSVFTAIRVSKNSIAIVIANLTPFLNCKNNGRLEERANEAEGGDCIGI